MAVDGGGEIDSTELDGDANGKAESKIQGAHGLEWVGTDGSDTGLSDQQCLNSAGEQLKDGGHPFGCEPAKAKIQDADGTVLDRQHLDSAGVQLKDGRTPTGSGDPKAETQNLDGNALDQRLKVQRSHACAPACTLDKAACAIDPERDGNAYDHESGAGNASIRHTARGGGAPRQPLEEAWLEYFLVKGKGMRAGVPIDEFYSAFGDIPV